MKLQKIVFYTLATECGIFFCKRLPSKNQSKNKMHTVLIHFQNYGLSFVLDALICCCFFSFCFSLALRWFGGTFGQYKESFFYLPTCLCSWLTWLAGWLDGLLLVWLHYLLMANNKRREQESHIISTVAIREQKLRIKNKNEIHLKNYTQNTRTLNTHTHTGTHF